MTRQAHLWCHGSARSHSSRLIFIYLDCRRGFNASLRNRGTLDALLQSYWCKTRGPNPSFSTIGVNGFGAAKLSPKPLQFFFPCALKIQESQPGCRRMKSVTACPAPPLSARPPERADELFKASVCDARRLDKCAPLSPNSIPFFPAPCWMFAH